MTATKSGRFGPYIQLGDGEGGGSEEGSDFHWALLEVPSGRLVRAIGKMRGFFAPLRMTLLVDGLGRNDFWTGSIRMALLLNVSFGNCADDASETVFGGISDTLDSHEEVVA